MANSSKPWPWPAETSGKRTASTSSSAARAVSNMPVKKSFAATRRPPRALRRQTSPPTACEVPDPVIVHLETPSPYTPLGAKGLGEGNNMSTPVVIANAFADALRPLRDVADVRLPLTPSRVLGVIHEASGAVEPAPPEGLGRRAEPAKLAGGLSLQASGSVDIAAPPEKVFAVLLDPVSYTHLTLPTSDLV